ncbi:MAG TPA: tRNA 2-thiouridine(34) synthase MnmA [Syntrophorhabdus sp.]|jgi:tRNA-specific 2-thiouridylase|nr:tRNA 2-thiouridine(34) synthase MnmA [Syntrophorhabdus sp.]HQI95474.1 tRNA 2-thiouridine(34) synthase MnmA [Syntrophorhabdus sp.]
MKTVFVAMSGGIDSSFAAYLLKREGFKVIGITFQLLPNHTSTINNSKTCCSNEAVLRAKKAADTMNIPHYVIDLRKEFEEFVIERFIKEYGAGRTPNPCVLCNQFIKFSAFFYKALALGGDYIATGHYAKIEKMSDNYFLSKATDKSKDQSYFLYSIKKDQLSRILLPLGVYTKSKILPAIREMGWKNTSMYKESQDLCFIPNGQYRSFLSNFMRLEKGPIFSIKGKLMGHHDGIHLYTIGQRRGLNIPYKEPLYVIEIRPHENCLIVGSKNHLMRKSLTATPTNLLSDISSGITAKVRYRQKEQPCSYSLKDDFMRVEFYECIDAITPGQSVVLYNEDVVVGGGIIKSSE